MPDGAPLDVGGETGQYKMVHGTETIDVLQPGVIDTLQVGRDIEHLLVTAR